MPHCSGVRSAATAAPVAGSSGRRQCGYQMDSSFGKTFTLLPSCPLYICSAVSLSTGPKTPQGKQRSTFKAVKHGILSRKWLRQDELDAFNYPIQNLESEYQPNKATQRIMIERLALAMTKLRRLYALENACISKHNRGPLLQRTVGETDLYRICQLISQKPAPCHPLKNWI